MTSWPGRAEVIDFHNHVIPGVDDGAREPVDAKAALEAMVASGVVALIATPHLEASLVRWPDRWAARLTELDAGWAELTRVAQSVPGAPRIERGVEVRLDTPEPDLSDPRTRLAGGRFALVEFPYFTIPPRSVTVLDALRAQDVVPVIAHPERYRGMREQVDLAREWKEAGAFLQLNGPSLLGRYGGEVKAAALLLLNKGLVDYVSSDYHARGRTEIAAYAEVLQELVGEEAADWLLRGNAARLLEGEPPLDVSGAARRRGLWSRVATLLRRAGSGRRRQAPSGRAAAPRSTHSRK